LNCGFYFFFNLGGDQEFKWAQKGIRHSFGGVGQLVVVKHSETDAASQWSSSELAIPRSRAGGRGAGGCLPLPVRVLPAWGPAVGGVRVCLHAASAAARNRSRVTRVRSGYLSPAGIMKFTV